MARFNTKTKKVKKVVKKNLAGGDAFAHERATELVHAVLTTFLDDKTYESGDERFNRIKDLISEILGESGVDGAEFIAKLAVIARQEFNMRTASHVLVGELSKFYKGDDLIKRAIVAVATRPDDCSEIAAYVGLPMPKQVKRGIRNAILTYSPYQIAKYKMEGRQFSMVDLFNLTHPKAQHATKEQKKAWKQLMEGTLKNTDTWESGLSNAESDEERTENIEALIKSGKIGYMALLRNLNNLIKYGVDEKIIAKAAKRLADKEEVINSKQLPFRFLTAYNNVSGNRVLRDAISEALDHSVGNVPELKGKTLIAIDKSGSMNPYLDKAAIFGAALMKANKNADVVFFSDERHEFNESSRLPVIDLSQKIVNYPLTGGTNTGLVFATTKKYDRVFIISDDSSWAGDAQSMYLRYKRAMMVDPFVYAIDIAGYGTTDITGKKVTHLAGWSDRVLDFVSIIEKSGKDAITNYVKNYKF